MCFQVVANVTVGVRPQLVGRPNELDVTVGDEATFECKYRAFPAPDVYWCHNKLPLTVSRRAPLYCLIYTTVKTRRVSEVGALSACGRLGVVWAWLTHATMSSGRSWLG